MYIRIYIYTYIRFVCFSSLVGSLVVSLRLVWAGASKGLAQGIITSDPVY